MTTEEKFKAIIKRASIENQITEPLAISVMLIFHYIEQLKTLGLIAGGEYQMSESGKKIVAICEEFDWTPSDSDISQFVNEMIHESERKMIECLIIKYRDDRQKLIDEISRMNDIINQDKKPKQKRKNKKL